MRVRDGNGQPAVLVVHVPPDGGTVRASLGSTAIELDPADVSRLVDIYRLAQTVALHDRGSW